MKFSICVPNFNYENYVEETVRSALDQDVDLELIFCDNASSDRSYAVVEAIGDPRVSLRRNRWNVGFAGNLDRACIGATGDRQILLSSDDVILPGALAIYRRVLEAMGDKADATVIGSAFSQIDGDGGHIADHGRDMRLWADSVRDDRLSDIAGCPVYTVPADKLLRRSLLNLRVPFAFLATCYSRKLYDAVEGYSNGRLNNPDKPFVWKILSVAETAIFVDRPLFGYRWHNNNQASLMQKSGAIKHMLDQYVSSFDTPGAVLKAADVDQPAMAKAFVAQDVVLRGFKFVADGDRLAARRGLHLGQAAYPHLSGGAKWWLLWLLSRLGPLGTAVASAAYRRRIDHWRQPDDTELK